MGALLDASGHIINLPSRLLVGRGCAAGLRLPDRSVSGEHAVVAWRNASWTVRDLGSLNGTFVNGERLEASLARELVAGDELKFGLDFGVFHLSSAAPAEAFARRLSDGVEVVAASELLGLPSPTRPTLQIMPLGLGWLCSGDAGDYPIGDGEVVNAGGEQWRVFLPGGDEETRRSGGSMRVRQLGLTFRVSNDEETVLIELRAPRAATLLESRAHNYLLLYLARRRLKDATLAHADQGWVDRATLAERLHLDPEHINVQLFRIRQDFARAGIADAGNLLECRRKPSQVRIGVLDLRIERLEPPASRRPPLAVNAPPKASLAAPSRGRA